MEDVKKTNKRILAIDILRGITIAGMVMVNNPGSWSHIFTPLDHAEWNGMTPTDLVFPFFMFVMGMCVFIALQKFHFEANSATVHKIIKRMVLIYLIGIGMGWFSKFCYRWANPLEGASFTDQLIYTLWSFDSIRLTGVLARLSVCYGITALLAITVKHKYLIHIIVTLLIGYFVILLLGNGFAYDSTNLLSIVDRNILTPNHMYDDNGIDPEGLLSTLPAIAHTLIGFLIGKRIFGERTSTDVSTDIHTHSTDIHPLSTDVRTHITLSKVVPLFVIGTILTFVGFLLSYGCPLNKKVWSPTFVLTTCGLASLFLALLIWIIDVRGYNKWCKFFEVFGVNPLFLFILSGFWAILFGSIHLTIGGESKSITGILYNNVYAPLFGETLGSLVYALMIVAINWCIGYYLYKKKIYIKL